MGVELLCYSLPRNVVLHGKEQLLTSMLHLMAGWGVGWGGAGYINTMSQKRETDRDRSTQTDRERGRERQRDRQKQRHKHREKQTNKDRNRQRVNYSNSW